MKQVYIIAGPNGSGKSTLAKELLLNIELPFLNADEFALSISGSTDVSKVRLTAGKQFINKFREYVEEGTSFALETTLSGKCFTRTLDNLRDRGYEIILEYMYSFKIILKPLHV